MMKNIHRYNNFLNESLSMSEENKQVTDDIVSIFQDIIDDGYDMIFNSIEGSMTFDQYSKKREHKFNPICFFSHNNKKVYDFSVIIQVDNYDDIIKIVDESQTFIGRLKEEGWKIADFKVNKNPDVNDTFQSILYTFKKPDVYIEEGEIKLPSTDFVSKIIDKYDIYIDDFGIYDEFIEIEYAPFNHHQDRKLGTNELDEIFNKMCDDLGCEYWTPGKSRRSTNFYY
jgi:hypothetical protein